MVQLEEMTDAEFERSRDRSIPMHAADSVRRGFWTPAAALETSRAEFAGLLPEGRRTSNKHFAKIVDDASGAVVGETWYTVQERGGKIQFFVDWIWIEPERLFDLAARSGADRVGLFVLDDNEGAKALYRKLGFQISAMRMVRVLAP
jgi:hypothetical protein